MIGNGVTRRRFLALSGALSASCASATAGRVATAGRLGARPGRAADQPLPPGEHVLGLGGGRDGLLYVPRDVPRPGAIGPALFVLLHGATGSARGMVSRLAAWKLADEHGMAVLAPDSRDRTWDVIRGEFGADVAFLERALAHTFARVAVDPARLAIGGFSDGASYALSLGLVNGDLFTHVIAFSPGFFVADETHGRPAIFMSHGTADAILPIDSTSRRLVPRLRGAGYDLQYREFDGPHTVPPAIAREACIWLKGGDGR